VVSGGIAQAEALTGIPREDQAKTCPTRHFFAQLRIARIKRHSDHKAGLHTYETNEVTFAQ
jgi:hypothetical protein